MAVVADYGAGVIYGDRDPRGPSFLGPLGRKGLCDSRYALGTLLGATIRLPNEPELASLTGLPVATDAELSVAASKALSLLGCETLLVTRGRRGMAVFESANPPTFIPVHGVADAVDVTGAGDTVIASFALALGAGASSAEAARIANIAGGLVVQKMGTATVSPEELMSELGG